MNCIGVGLLINPGTLLEDSYMRNIIVRIIFLLTLVAANGVAAKPVNECIACQNRCAKKFPGLGSDYSNCKLECKGSGVCLGNKRSKKG